MYYVFLTHLMQKHEYSKIAIPLKSIGRVYNEKSSLLRPPYQRDRDRVIHSTAFRRLKHKTQVFVNTDVDHYRTRITHSLEVSQIARTFAKIFKLNEDLCETLSLAHDLGHPPFGHAGEESLNQCMENFFGFDHNIQTLRIVTILENKYYNFRGLNLSLETLDGLIKHNGAVVNSTMYNEILGENIFKNKIKFNNKPSLEAQFSSISDDIAYNSHDLQDGIKAGLFKLEDLLGIPVISEIIYKHKKKHKSREKELILNQIVRDIINEMVKDVVKNTTRNIRQENPKHIQGIYKAKTQLVEFSEKMKDFDQEIKFFLMENMYKHKVVSNKTKKGMKIVKTLFKKITKNPKKFIKNKYFYKFEKERMVCDFIAGMTDRYAIKLYNSIK
tara:strand:+ start:6726 stop:7883 length:1158 start_codon:yes stop_codon:yes gene_type:complete